MTPSPPAGALAARIWPGRPGQPVACRAFSTSATLPPRIAVAKAICSNRPIRASFPPGGWGLSQSRTCRVNCECVSGMAERLASTGVIFGVGGGQMEPFLRLALRHFIRGRKSAANHRGGKDSPLATAPARRWRSAFSRARPSAACCSIPSFGLAKLIWMVRWWSRKARSPTCLPSCWTAPRRQAAGLGTPAMARALHVSSLAAVQPATRARRNVAHHYDLEGELYDLFLDATGNILRLFRNTRAGRWTTPSCQEAPHRGQAAARAGASGARHRLRLGRACALSCGACGAHVTGITLSAEQLAFRASARAEAGWRTASSSTAGLPRRDGQFDRIVSVGMFEHVGVGYTTPSSEHARPCSTDDG